MKDEKETGAIWEGESGERANLAQIGVRLGSTGANLGGGERRMIEAYNRRRKLLLGEGKKTEDNVRGRGRDIRSEQYGMTSSSIFSPNSVSKGATEIVRCSMEVTGN